MKSSHLGLVLCCAVGLLVGRSAVAAIVTVNIDLNGNPAGGDVTHVGADGPISAPGGTFWNGVTEGLNANNLADEFGNPTTVDFVFQESWGGRAYTDAGINDLQDSGMDGVFEVRGLASGDFSIAGYVGFNAGFSLTDISGRGPFNGFGRPELDGWSLPGTAGHMGDYFLLEGATPYPTGNGDYAFTFSTDGPITGLQIRGPVPEPATAAILLLGSLAGLTRRRTRA